MGYTRNTWAIREGTNLNRWRDTITNTFFQFVNEPTEITAAGTPFRVDWMNNIEAGLQEVADNLNDLRVYRTLTEINATFDGSTSMIDLFNAMRDNSVLLLPLTGAISNRTVNAATHYPAPFGFMIIWRATGSINGFDFYSTTGSYFKATLHFNLDPDFAGWETIVTPERDNNFIGDNTYGGSNTYNGLVAHNRGTQILNTQTENPLPNIVNTDALYQRNFRRELKLSTTVGLNDIVPDTFVTVETYFPWFSSAGGNAYRTALTSQGMYFQTAVIGAAAWGDWEQIGGNTMFNKPVFYTLDGTATILDIPPNTSTGEQTIDVITSPNDIVVTNYDNRNYIPIVEGLPFPAGLDWSFIVRNEFLDGNGNIIFVSSPRSNAGVGSPPSFANPLDDIPNLNIGEGELLGPAVLMENGFTFRTRYIINNQTTLTFRLRWNANATIDWELVGLEEF